MYTRDLLPAPTEARRRDEEGGRKESGGVELTGETKVRW